MLESTNTNGYGLKGMKQGKYAYIIGDVHQLKIVLIFTFWEWKNFCVANNKINWMAMCLVGVQWGLVWLKPK